MVIKDAIVLARIAGPGHGENVLFMQRTRTSGRAVLEELPTLFLTADDFHAMGSPEEITVTIEPGNTVHPPRGRCSCGKVHPTLSEELAAHGDPGS